MKLVFSCIAALRDLRTPVEINLEMAVSARQVDTMLMLRLLFSVLARPVPVVGILLVVH